MVMMMVMMVMMVMIMMILVGNDKANVTLMMMDD